MEFVLLFYLITVIPLLSLVLVSMLNPVEIPGTAQGSTYKH